MSRRPDPLREIAKLRGGKLSAADLRLFARLAGSDALADAVDQVEDLASDLAVLENWRDLDELLAQDPENLLDER